MKIYTKKGDFGETGLLTGKRVPKNNLYIQGLGVIDETLASLGLVHAELLEKGFNSEAAAIEKIQKALFYIGFIVVKEGKMDKGWPKNLTEELERAIDAWDAQLPPLKNFILPGGGKTSALIHQARSTARRMERELLPVLKKSKPHYPALSYINRLSDYLFTLARWIASKENTREILIHPDDISDFSHG